MVLIQIDAARRSRARLWCSASGSASALDSQPGGNLVAITTLVPSASSPNRCSDAPPLYIAAVSKKFAPADRLASKASCSSSGPAVPPYASLAGPHRLRPEGLPPGHRPNTQPRYLEITPAERDSVDHSPTIARHGMSLNFVRRVLTRHQNPEKGLKHRTTPRVVWRLSCRPRAGGEFTEKLLIRTSAHPVRLKCPKRAMAGAWPSLNNRPARSSTRYGTEEPSGPRVSPSLSDEQPVTTGPGAAAGVRRTKGMRRGSPPQPQGRNHLPQLPPYRRGRRPPPRLTQDRVPLGQGRQATLPEDPGRSPPLPRSRDPRPGRGTSRGSHRLSGAVRSFPRDGRPLPGQPHRRPAGTRPVLTGK